MWESFKSMYGWGPQLYTPEQQLGLDQLIGNVTSGAGPMDGISQQLTRNPGEQLSALQPAMQKWIGTKDAPGLATFGLGAASSLMNAFMGMKQYGLAKDSFNLNKEAYYNNYNMQKKSLNTALEDRQRARVASNPSAYQSVDAYMKERGL